MLKVHANVNMINFYFQLKGLQEISVTVARTTVVTTAHDLQLDEAFCILLKNFGSFDTNTSLSKPKNSCDIGLYHYCIQFCTCTS